MSNFPWFCLLVVTGSEGLFTLFSPCPLFPPQLNVLLPPATKLGQGNIFRSMCQEFCSQGGSPGPHPGWGCPGPGPKGGMCIPACTEPDPPPSRRLLLRAVRILLECILVFIVIRIVERNWICHPFCPLFTPSLVGTMLNFNDGNYRQGLKNVSCRQTMGVKLS